MNQEQSRSYRYRFRSFSRTLSLPHRALLTQSRRGQKKLGSAVPLRLKPKNGRSTGDYRRSGVSSVPENDQVMSAAKSSLDHDMTTISKHFFGEIEDGFSISIIENMKEEYGLYVWPCSIILAEYIWQQKSRFTGANVVELGAGTSLPGLVAVKVGADVTLTDDSNRSEVLDNMSRACELNDIKCKVMGLTWGVWDALVFTLQPDIILGADVLYDSTTFDDLFATVSFLLHKRPDSVFITTYHNRSGHHLIELLMVKWGLKCTKLVDGFSFMPSHKASRLSGNIQLVEIVSDALL